MTITVQSFIMMLAIVCLLLATVGVVPSFKYWSWFPGGMLLWAISLFMSVNVH